MKREGYKKICLASQSPRRQQLLTQIGVDFEIVPANIDESVRVNEAPFDYVQRITLAKARSVWTSSRYHRKFPVLASDTAVVMGLQILGKPMNRTEGLQMIGLLSGKEHQVLSGVALIGDGFEDYRVNQSSVRFNDLSQQEMHDYWNSKEGWDKAGGYAVQGLAAMFIESVCGSYSGIMGLPLFETGQMIRQRNILCWQDKIDSKEVTYE